MKAVHALLLAALGLFVPLTVFASGPAVTLTPVTLTPVTLTPVTLTPVTLEVPAGQVAPLEVRVTDVTGLYGFELSLQFDPAVVEVVDADPRLPGVQALPGDFLSLDMLVRNRVDNAAGTVEYVLTQMNPSEARSGAGVLLTLYIKGKTPGKTAPVRIVKALLATRNGEPIPVDLSAGEVRVVDASPASALTSTPLPTAESPRVDLTAAVEGATPGPEPTATPAATRPPAPVTSTGAPTASVPTAAAPTASPPPAAVSRPTQAPAASSSPVSPTSAPVLAVSRVTAPPAPTRVSATAAPPKPSATAPAAAVIEPRPVTSAQVAAAALPPRNLTLLFAGGGLLLAAAAGILLLVLRRGR